ncbi:ABC transporter ATP-binding protein [Ramlibacter sp.]|uniref:ABC transporter ATP-binding protein n=1 Tax=Ramlibacter sp. TaxID=1917967 RepID=UPI0035B29466
MTPTEAPLLQVEDLAVRFRVPEGEVAAVNGLDFRVARGQTFGIVGESGSGKSQSMLAIMGLLAANGRATGRALFQGQDLLALDAAALNRLRGNRIAMIFQDTMTSLNPYLTVERQMTEVLELHKGLTRRSARQLAIETLESVSIPDAARRITMYPHEFSGGMRQRIMIAMALLCQPDLLIADEPTTALDVTVQAQTVQLLRELQRTHGTAIVLITHDLGVVAGLCDDVMVMYGGRVMEQAGAEALFDQPSHPYTVGLLGAVPRLGQDDDLPLAAIPGSPPNMLRPPAGCPFGPRCALAADRCATQPPALVVEGARRRACHESTAAVTALRAARA